MPEDLVDIGAVWTDDTADSGNEQVNAIWSYYLFEQCHLEWYIAARHPRLPLRSLMNRACPVLVHLNRNL